MTREEEELLVWFELGARGLLEDEGVELEFEGGGFGPQALVDVFELVDFGLRLVWVIVAEREAGFFLQPRLVRISGYVDSDLGVVGSQGVFVDHV
tara:strand:- start:24143 stop:24427 length:285 start_codon:yes stop_codon:yes gene_type:complete